MKIKDLKIEGKTEIDGELEVHGNIILSTDTENGYVIGLPINTSPNWFQRLLYKILGFKVTKK